MSPVHTRSMFRDTLRDFSLALELLGGWTCAPLALFNHDLAGGIVLCAFEDAMLDVMRHAILVG